MSFKTITCWNCHTQHEFYQHLNIVPPCPHCGCGANGSKPLTADEYYRSMGVTPTVKESLTVQSSTKS